MRIEEFFPLTSVEIELTRPEPEKAQDKDIGALGNVKARLKTEYVDQVRRRKALEEWEYKGFLICHSLITGKWWVMTRQENQLMSWATDRIDGELIIDNIVRKQRES